MGKQITDAKRRAIKKYDAANTKQVHLKLNINTDAGIIAWLDHIGNVQGYIKALIDRDRKISPDMDAMLEEYTSVKVNR